MGSKSVNAEVLTMAFYNVENLFDIVDDPYFNDDDFLPNSAKRWTKKRYDNKIFKLGSVIEKIGNFSGGSTHPSVVGLAEVENKKVLTDLINSPDLRKHNYNFVHYDSLDERGIDVALLYDSSVFKVEHSETFSVYLDTEDGNKDYSRDILLVKGYLRDQHLAILVNHWSSRREGEAESVHKRKRAAGRVNFIIERLRVEDPDMKIVVMGDFNDNPFDESISMMTELSSLFNPFNTLISRDKGSLNHRFQWNMFDQILFSVNFLDSSRSLLKYENADVFNHKFVTQYRSKYSGQPFRTYIGKKYQGGYSDHFPVFIQFKLKI